MSDYRLVVAVSNPASGDPLVRMGSALARVNNESLITTSVTAVPPHIPVTADDKFASQQEAIGYGLGRPRKTESEYTVASQQ